MFVRIRLAATAEVYGGIASQPEIARIELGMLAGEHERRSDPTRGKRMGDGRQFDGFRPGADDQPDIDGTQYSP
jgi:hypothetical protein